MKLIKLATPLVTLLCMSFVSTQAMEMDHHSEPQCGDPAKPLLSVADFDGNGSVNYGDIAVLAKAMRADTHQGHGDHKSHLRKYSALFDRNADGKVTSADMVLAVKDLGKSSTQFDQEIAGFYNRFAVFQNVEGYEQLDGMGYFPIPVAMKGHGVHWFNDSGFAAMMGFVPADPYIAQGLNVESEDKKVHALFWGSPAVPVFDNGALDYPWGDNWKDAHVIAFADAPPKFTSSPHEHWHTHGALCMPVVQGTDENGNPTMIGYAHQFVTYNECQAMDSDMRMPDGSVMWANFWMIHMWLFDLNPNGLFAGTHPCVEPNGLGEETLVGDREVPHFFMGH